jgi:hypothetical protein
MTAPRKRYDWRACGIALVAGFAVAIPAGLAVIRFVDSSMLLVAVVTTVGTSVSGWAYARAARPGARPIEDEHCEACETLPRPPE